MILVTGANGFVGQALCRRLLARGGQVRGSVRSKARAAGLPAGVEPVVVPEIGPDSDWTAALTGIRTVIHLAALVHEEAGDLSEEAYFRINVAGTERLARMASAGGVGRFVFLSTVKVHGEGSPTPYDEDSPCIPRGPYGRSKLEAEVRLRKTGRETGLETVIIRPPLVYGPGVKANFFRLMATVERGIPLPFAGVNNRRSLIYLGNLTDAVAACAVHEKAAGRTFLVSDGQDVSTPELIRKIAGSLERPARLLSCPLSCLRLLARIAGKSSSLERITGSLSVDSGRIRRELGWKPPFTMTQGLKDTAQWFKRQL